jgi:hypothetical protein
MRKNRKILTCGVFISLFMTQSFANESLEEANMQKSCSYLKEKSIVSHCINEQKDELLIKKTSGRGFEYISKNAVKIMNDISTPVGLHYFVNELENKALSPNVLDKSKEEQMLELKLVKTIYKNIKIKNDKFKINYKKDLSKWSLFADKDIELEEKVRKFAKNRIVLNDEMQNKIHFIEKIVKDKEDYIKVKKINRDLIFPLYMGEEIKVSKDECKIINEIVPNLFEQKKDKIKGCKK